MNLNEQLDDNFNVEALDLETRTAFLEAAKWTNVLVIIGAIFLSLISLVAIGAMLTGGTEEYALLGLIFTLLFFGIPLYYLFQFTTKTKRAIKNLDDVLFTVALKNLKSLFKFFGILSLLSIAYALFAMVFMFIMMMGAF